MDTIKKEKVEGNSEDHFRSLVESIVYECLKRAGVLTTREVPISRKELMKRLGMNATTLRRNELKGNIPRFMAGGKVRYFWSEVVAQLQKTSNNVSKINSDEHE